MAIKTDAYYASCTYDSPVGMLTLAASEEGLKGLWLNGQKYFAGTLDRPMTEGANDHLDQASHWLDAYFAASLLLSPRFPWRRTGAAFNRPYGSCSAKYRPARYALTVIWQRMWRRIWAKSP